MPVRIVAVTGAAGNLGTILCKKLYERGIKVFALARASDPIERIKPYVAELIVGSITNPADIRTLLNGADAVVNCAALLPASLALGEENFFNVNVKGAQVVLEEAHYHSIKKLVFLSTIGVLNHSFFLSKTDMFKYRTQGLDHYSRSKIALEKMLFKEGSSKKLDITILRPSFIYGPTFVSFWAEALETIKCKKMYLLGSGQGLFPLVHGDDVANYIIDRLEKPVDLGLPKVLYATDPFPMTTRNLFNLFANYFDVPAPRSIPTTIAYCAANIVELLPRFLRLNRLKLLTVRRVREYSTGYDLSAFLEAEDFDFNPRISIEKGMISMLDAFEDERRNAISTKNISHRRHWTYWFKSDANSLHKKPPLSSSHPKQVPFDRD